MTGGADLTKVTTAQATGATELATREAAFTAKKAEWDALLLAEKEAARGGLVTQYEDAKQLLQDLNDKKARLERADDQAGLERLGEELRDAEAAYTTANLNMDDINREEAQKLELEKQAQWMADKMEKEMERQEKVDRFINELAEMDSEIYYYDEQIKTLIDENKITGMSAEDISKNKKEISALRDKFFKLEDTKKEK